jgi:hypothetical protein
MSTLIEQKTPVAGTPPATPAPATPPSSGGDAAKPGEQMAPGKESPKATPDGDKAAPNDGGNDPEGEKPKKAAPDAYEFKPSEDGATVGAEVQSALTEVGKELDLTQDAMQALVAKVSPALRAQQKANLTAMIEGWVSETQRDAEIGGTKLDETLRYAQAALEHVPPGLRKLLGPVDSGGTGLGNHRDVIAGFAALGRKLSPDGKVVTGPAVPNRPPRSAEERLADTYR